MGLYERNYYRQPPPGKMGAVRLWSLTTWIIAINVAVFIIQAILIRVALQHAIHSDPNFDPLEDSVPDLLTRYFAFSIHDGILNFQFWRILSYAFLHNGPWHILMNMIGLWLFGPVVELTLGSRRFTFFYILCAIAGPLMYA